MASDFDHQWSQMSKALGFQTSTANNRLGYGYEDAHRNVKLPRRGRENGQSQIQYDDQRRGAFVNPYDREQNQPVNFNRGGQAGDIAPTVPMNRAALPAHQSQANNQQQNIQPLALTNGGGASNQNAQRQATINQRQAANNFAVPKTSKPARAF